MSAERAVGSERPLVTVVVPAYQAQDTIESTVASVLEQTMSDLELIVVDDGSTDGTGSQVERFGPPVRLLRQANGGVSRARNAGIAEAMGPLIAFLDADDVWHPQKLERQVALLTGSPAVGMCFTAAERVDESGRSVGEISAEYYEDYVLTSLLKSAVVTCASSTTLARTGLVRDVGGFDVRFSQCADWDFTIRMGLAAPIAPIPEKLIEYRVSADQMSANIGLLERDTFAVLDAFYSRPESARYRRWRRRAYANHWSIIAGSYLQAGRPADAVRSLAHAAGWDPRALGHAAAMPIRRLRKSVR